MIFFHDGTLISTPWSSRLLEFRHIPFITPPSLSFPYFYHLFFFFFFIRLPFFLVNPYLSPLSSSTAYARYLKFTRKIFTDVCKVLLLGKRCVLQCLLKMRSIFEHTDSHYLLNKLFLGDFTNCCLLHCLPDSLHECLPAFLPIIVQTIECAHFG